MKEGVYFPPYFRECYISDRLKKFFEVNNLNSKSIVFDINILRKEFKRDYQNFTLIKEELELKGFNFVSNKNNSYFAKNIDYSSCEFIVNKVNDTLNPITLHKMGLWSLFSKLGLQDRNDLHYVPLERIEMLIYNSSNIRNLLIQYQFEIIKGWKNEEDITPLLSYDNSILFKVHETTDYYFEKGLSFGFPKICLKFLCKLATLPHTVKRILNESGIHTINDLLDITNTKKLEIINNVYESLDYSVDSGKFNRIFDDYFIELTSCKNSYFELKKNFEVLTRLSFSDTLFAKQKIINKVGVNIFNNIDFNNYRKQYVIFDFDYSFLFKRFNKIEGLKFNEQFSNCFHLFEINLHQVFVLNQLHFNSIDDFAVLNLNMNISRFGTISKDIRFKLIDIYSIFNLIDSVICEYSVEDPFQIDYIRNVFENITDQETYMIKLQLILKEMDINVLKRRDDEETLSEVAKVYGITRERIRQIEKRSIKRIHDICKNLLFDMFRYSDCYNIDDLKIYPGLLTYLRYNNSEYRMIKDNGILVSSKSFDYLDYQIKKFHELTHISVKVFVI